MKLPVLDKLFLETPLYETFDISHTDGEYIFELLYFLEKIDSYCPFCDKSSTFKGINALPQTGVYRIESYSQYAFFNVDIFPSWINRIHQINLVCTRDESHLMQFSFYLTKDQLIKIGQYPSIADISIPDLKKYREVLSVSIRSTPSCFHRKHLPTFRDSLKCSENFDRLKRRSCCNFGFEV